MFQPQGYQYQDWNNQPYQNNGYRGRCGGRSCGGQGSCGGCGYNRRERKYCWTHGLTGHNGRECNSPMQGHQANSTLEIRMGGSTKDLFAWRCGIVSNNIYKSKHFDTLTVIPPSSKTCISLKADLGASTIYIRPQDKEILQQQQKYWKLSSNKNTKWYEHAINSVRSLTLTSIIDNISKTSKCSWRSQQCFFVVNWTTMRRRLHCNLW